MADTSNQRYKNIYCNGPAVYELSTKENTRTGTIFSHYKTYEWGGSQRLEWTSNDEVWKVYTEMHPNIRGVYEHGSDDFIIGENHPWFNVGVLGLVPFGGTRRSAALEKLKTLITQ